MPLMKGGAGSTISQNIKELMDSWKRSGKIGTSTPANQGEAMKQAVAIAFAAAGRSRKKKGWKL